MTRRVGAGVVRVGDGRCGVAQNEGTKTKGYRCGVGVPNAVANPLVHCPALAGINQSSGAPRNGSRPRSRASYKDVSQLTPGSRVSGSVVI